VTVRHLHDILLTVVAEPGAIDLAHRLDGLPLALATAGAYLEQVAVTCAEYLQLYHELWLQLHEDAPQLLSYDQTLYSTWNLSYRRIEQQDSVAAMFLQQWAYFSNEDIWYELLKGDGETKPGWFAEMTTNKLRFHSTMRVLCNHGLAEVGPSPSINEAESQGYSVHACVHAWMMHVLNQETDATMIQSALHCVASRVPGQDERGFWIVQRRLLPHADKCFETMKSARVDAEAAVDLNSLGNFYADQGRLQEAEAMYQRALDGYEKALGPTPVVTYIPSLNTLENLADLYMELGRTKEAWPYYQRVQIGVEAVLGRESQRYTRLASWMNSVGSNVA
jgi:tetratricopeptide (TPR) repeat protein